jgi:hypothetical protein
MDVLGKPRLYGRKKQQARHPQFSHDVSGFFLVFQPQHDAFAEPLDSTYHCARIPIAIGIAFANDIGSTEPTARQYGPNQAGANLPGDDFGFRKFRHVSD